MWNRSADPLASASDLRVLAVQVGCDFLVEIVRGLSATGAQVTLVRDGVPVGADGLATQDWIDIGSRDAIGRAIDRLILRSGMPDLVVVSIAPREAVQVSPLVGWNQETWQRCVLDALRQTMWLLDALGRHLKERGGAVALVAPSLSLVGAPHLVALTTLLEGQRGLMKSVARQWGGAGVRLNWIAVAPRALSPVFDNAPLAAKPDAVSVALGRGAAPETEVVAVLKSLAGLAGSAMTGLTMTIDGGEWMVP